MNYVKSAIYYPSLLGIGLHYSLSGPVANNSIVRANSDGSTGVFQCISGSTQPNVGQWIAPDGQELSLSADSPFTVTIGDSTNPGYLSTVVTNGHSLSNVDQGVYSCVLPDESGNEQIIHVGIYLSGFNSEFHKCINVAFLVRYEVIKT